MYLLKGGGYIIENMIALLDGENPTDRKDVYRVLEWIRTSLKQFLEDLIYYWKYEDGIMWLWNVFRLIRSRNDS